MSKRGIAIILIERAWSCAMSVSEVQSIDSRDHAPHTIMDQKIEERSKGTIVLHVLGSRIKLYMQIIHIAKEAE